MADKEENVYWFFIFSLDVVESSRGKAQENQPAFYHLHARDWARKPWRLVTPGIVLVSSPEGAPSPGGLCWASAAWLSITHDAWLAGASPQAPSAGRKGIDCPPCQAVPTTGRTNDQPMVFRADSLRDTLISVYWGFT